MRRRTGRASLREILERNNAADAYYAAMAGKEPQCQVEIKAKRTRAASTGPRTRPLERDVLKEVLHALRSDPRVALCERQQVGTFIEGNRHIRIGSRGALDIKGMLVGGKYFELETKRDAQSKPTPEQSERIAAIRANGGIAGWCWSAESALALLP